MPYSVIAIGTSWGGLAALTKLLGDLPQDFRLPVVVVQHRSTDTGRLLVQLLQDATDLRVCEIEDKDPLTPGTVHVAPANYHILIEDGYASLSVEEPVRFSRPSIDVMFTSVADTYQSAAIGIVLTGANEDGAQGLAHIARRGGRALVQDPKTAEIPIMPEAAIRAVPTAEVLTLGALAPRLIELSLERAKVGAGRAV
ncbi:MAG: chemotaxis protein CheB [Gemmatimonadota bacterium]|nr:chemotaxis protein CheB [Gemmatimonadota bacterium]